MDLASDARRIMRERRPLLHWMRSTKTERRMVERARVILLAANRLNGKWLRRFAKDRIAGLLDAPRPGEKRRKYNPAAEELILKALDEPPPAGLQPRERATACRAFGPGEQGSGLAGNAKAPSESGSPAELVCRYRSGVQPQSG
jgi:hypothetical protein